MSRLLELAQQAQNSFTKQAEHTEQELQNAMQQHRQAIERDLNELHSAISANILDKWQSLEQQLSVELTARPKRIARWWWTISAFGVIASLLTWGLTLWQGNRALENLRQAESAKSNGAVITNCVHRNRLDTVKCVRVKVGQEWPGDKKGTAYMEISR